MAVAPPDPTLVDKVVIANRILYDQGVVDGLGHVSVRHDSAPGVFLLSCNRAPGLVRHADILCYDLDGNTLTPTSERSYLERFIHSEIYRARPDVMAVVHSHSPSVIPFGATGNRLRPIFHMAGFLGSGSTIFDQRDAAGDTDLLVRNGELGKALAQSLGRCSCVLMRGHGSTVVATSIEQAVYRAIYAEVNAKLQAQALGMGQVTYLTPQEADLAAASNDTQIPRSWDLWRRRIGPIDGDRP
jgi:ribulose-5-phosphate 4-epimerase/fuculose-1-phosphate aldolase